jgi:hypothetical protein
VHVSVGDENRRYQEGDPVSGIPECPHREGWKWEEMGTQLCRASMLKGPYAIQWDKGIWDSDSSEWEVIKGHRAMTIVVATPFNTADKAMNKAERMAVNQKVSG